MNIDTNSKKLMLEYHAQWKIDVKTGEVSFPQKKRRYEAENASIGGGAKVKECKHCRSKRGVHQSKLRRHYYHRSLRQCASSH